MRLPTGSCPGQSWSAMYSSTMTATGFVVSSCSLKNRPTPQRDFHGFKVVPANDALVRIEKFLAGERHTPFDGDRRPSKGFAQGK